jgi:hypothetical protein
MGQRHRWTHHDDYNGFRTAVRAMGRAGDVNWWDGLGSCQHGNDYAAIAARDLIGTVPGSPGGPVTLMTS